MFELLLLVLGVASTVGGVIGKLMGDAYQDERKSQMLLLPSKVQVKVSEATFSATPSIQFEPELVEKEDLDVTPYEVEQPQQSPPDDFWLTEPAHTPEWKPLNATPTDTVTSPPSEPLPVILENCDPVFEEATNPTDVLLNKLRSHGGGWVLDILEVPILIWGSQGSSKSYMASFLAAVRMVLRGHEIEVNDPHLPLNRFKAWKPLIERKKVECFGSSFEGKTECGYDYESIAKRIAVFQDRLKKATPDKTWNSPIFDELTQYGKHIEAASEALVLSCLSDCRKANESPILLSHSNTSLLTGKTKGTSRLMDEGLVQLHLYSSLKEGKYYPLFKGELKGLPDENGSISKKNISLDSSWMTADWVFDLFEKSNEPGESEAEYLLLSNLPEPYRTVWCFIRDRKSAGLETKVRDIQRKDFAVLKGANAERIGEILNNLSANAL